MLSTDHYTICDQIYAFNIYTSKQNALTIDFLKCLSYILCQNVDTVW